MRKGDSTALVLNIGLADPAIPQEHSPDVEVFSELGVRELTVAATARTSGGRYFEPLPADVLSRKLVNLPLCDIRVIRIGALGSKANMQVVSWFLQRASAELVILDPVLHSSAETWFGKDDYLTALRLLLLPLAKLVVPNLEEATALAGMRVFNVDTMKTAAREIHAATYKLSGGKCQLDAVLIKGGLLKGDAVDVMYYKGEILLFRTLRFDIQDFRGIGGVLTAAIAVYLAQGSDLPTSVDKAKQYLVKRLSSLCQR